MTGADGSNDPAQRAIYYAPHKAFARGGPPVRVHVFEKEYVRAASVHAITGFVPLDFSGELQLPWPATTPLLLARYLVLRQGDLFTCSLASCGEIYYVLSGDGFSRCDGDRIEWQCGDAFCLPGFRSTSHCARSGLALLLVVTNEPEMARLCDGATWRAGSPIPPTHFPSARVAAALDEVHGREGPQLAAGKSVVLVSAPMAALNLTTPTILASFNTLEPGGDQRPHQHNSVALTLSIQGEGVHSMIDGRRIDWIDGVVSLTPPGAVHSHHNRGPRRMISFVAQDTGLHTHLRTTGFRWTDL